MAVFFLHVINQQTKLRNISFSINKHVVDPCEPCMVVHPTHILVHPRVHRAHQLKGTGLEQSHKSSLAFNFQYEHRPWSVAYRSFWSWEFQARGIRKVTTGITGLRHPSIYSDFASSSFYYSILALPSIVKQDSSSDGLFTH